MNEKKLYVQEAIDTMYTWFYQDNSDYIWGKIPDWVVQELNEYGKKNRRKTIPLETALAILKQAESIGVGYPHNNGMNYIKTKWKKLSV